jgi:hypothetical protein
VDSGGTLDSGTKGPNVTALILAANAGLNSGQSTTLTWTSENATSCTITATEADGGGGLVESGTDGGLDNVALSGSVTIWPQQSTTYSLSCEGTGGPATSETTVTVSSIDSLVAGDAIIAFGASTTITWVTRGTANCALTGLDAIVGGDVDDGTATVTPTQTRTYTLTCSSVGTPNMLTEEVTVRVLKIDTFAVVGGVNAVRADTEIVLSWTVNEANSCTLTSDVGGVNVMATLPSWTFAHTPTQTTRYTLSCTGDDATQTSAEIDISLMVTIVDFSAVVISLTEVQFSWQALWGQSNGCSITDGDTTIANQGLTDSVNFNDVSNGLTTYSLTCTGSGTDHVVSMEVWGGTLTIDSPADVTNLDAIDVITGDLQLDSPNTITQVTAGKLKAIGQLLHMEYDNNLQSVSMPMLTTVGGNFTLASNMVMDTVDFPALTYIGGALELRANDSLCDSFADAFCTNTCTVVGNRFTDNNDDGC